MYFQKPGQLQNLFESLEEENLFSMKHIQEIEQNLENFKHTFEKKKVKLLEQEQILQKNKQELVKAFKVNFFIVKMESVNISQIA